MPTIRIGNAGNSVPGRPLQVSQPAGAFGAGTAAAVENLGRVATGMALDSIAAETRLQQEEMGRQKAQAEAVERAKEGAALHETQDKLRDLHDSISDRVLTGQLARDQAETEFANAVKETIDGSMERFRPESRQLVAPRLQSDSLTLGNSLRRTVEKRGKQEVTASITQSLEYFERLYQTDRQKAEAGVAGVLQAMGPWSDLAPEQLAKLGQGWRERTQFNSAQRSINAVRRDNAQLDAAAKALDGPEYADLDPGKKGQLLTQIEGYRVANAQKAEADARRREAEQERALRKAEHVMKAADTIVTAGRMLSPEFAQEAAATVAGTPYAEALNSLIRTAQDRTAFALRPLSEQRAILAAERQRLNAGSDPRAEERYSNLIKTNAAVEKAFKDDPISAGEQYGLYKLDPLPLNDLSQLAPALRVRNEQAALAARQTDKPVSPFTAQEAERVAEMMGNLPAADRSRIVASMAGSVTPQTAGAIATQLDKKDRALGLAFAIASSSTTNGRLTSELVLKGAQAKKDGTSTKGEKVPDVSANKWKASAAAAVTDVFPTQGLSDAYRDAAELIMHGIAAEQGGRLSQRDMERAVELAIGGKLIEHNGRKTPLPAGMDEDMLTKRMRSVTPDEIGSPTVLAGGVEVKTDEWVKSLPGAELVYAGPGRYSVLVRGRPVIKPDGKRVVIGVAP